MKHLIFLGFYVGGLVVCCYLKTMDKPKYIIDPPEEYGAITNNPNKPDTLTAYITGNTIHISFTGKHK